MPRFLPRLAFLLRPGWIALALVVVAFTYLCFTVLAPWQLGKNTRTSRENQQIEYSLSTPPVPLKAMLPQQDSSAPNEQWRRVTATGHYLPDVQVLARLRVVDGDQAFEVLTPFVVDGGPTVLVDRGYVRPEPGSHVPEFPRPPQETVALTARLRDSEPLLKDKEPFSRDGVQQVYSINTDQVSALTKVPLAGSDLQLVENQPGGLGLIGVPHLDAGPFFVLRHPVDFIRHPRAHRAGLFRLLRNPRPPPRSASSAGAGSAKPSRTSWPTGTGAGNSGQLTHIGRSRHTSLWRRRHHLRPPHSDSSGGQVICRSKAGTSEVVFRAEANVADVTRRRGVPNSPANNAAAACTARDSTTARRRSSTVGCAPLPRVGRICSSCWYWVGPPNRMPSAPAKAASDDACVGTGMPGGVLAPGPRRTQWRPTDHRRAHHHQRRRHPRGDVIGRVIQSRCGPAEPVISR